MRVAILGCGSIGKRHAQNIEVLGLAEEVVLFDTDISRMSGLCEKTCILRTDNICKVLSASIDAVVVCLPTSLHVEFSKMFISRGIDTFIEKPLSNKISGLTRLRSSAVKNKAKVMVGMTYRFHPIARKIKELIDKGIIGKAYSVNYSIGQNLLTWPSGSLYRDSYISKKSLGGGVTLTTLSHMIDLVKFLFGPIDRINFMAGKISDFDIETDDIVVGSLRTKNGTYVSCQADLMRAPRKNEIYVVGQYGSFVGDLYTSDFTLYGPNGGVIESSSGSKFDFNSFYLEEMLYFFDCLKSDKEPEPGIDDAKDTLRLLLKILNGK